MPYVERRPMSGEDFMLWRHRMKLTKRKAAELLGMHHNSLANWESGRTRVPLDIMVRIDAIAAAMTDVAAAAPPPTTLTSTTAKLRPDLKLYEVFRSSNGPAIMMAEDHPGKNGFLWRAGPPLPWSILSDPLYVAHVVRRRAYEGKAPLTRDVDGAPVPILPDDVANATCEPEHEQHRNPAFRPRYPQIEHS